jgi:hypothetical protein
MEVQSTALLMKKCGATEGGQHQHTTMVEEFTETFVEPLVDDTVSGYRQWRMQDERQGGLKQWRC